MQDLTGFQVERVLHQDERTKIICLLGRWPDKEGLAIIKLARQHFNTEQMPALLGKGSIRLGQRHFQNDVYSKFSAQMPEGSADITVDLTFPATQKHIDKNEVQEVFMVQETPELYKAVVLPHIESFPASRLQWVYNILEKMAEVERLLFEDPDPATGFMLHPDLKWDQAQVTGLYCVAICHRRDVRSLRDLRAEHLPLLLNIRQKGAQVILNRFQVPDDRLRIYLHYQPSYYHLHVHFAHLQLDLGGGAAVGKAYLLDDVIDNIRMTPAFYSHKTLTYTLGQKDQLLAKLRSQAGN